jgi:site-specific DNA-methyltransferase (cytosine-N4-specific)
MMYHIDDIPPHLREFFEAPPQIGLEPTFDEWLAAMVDVFRHVRDVLADDGTVWLNIGDAYAGSWGGQGQSPDLAGRAAITARQLAASARRTAGTGSSSRLPPGIKPKDMLLMPERLAIALQMDGWWVRSRIIWQKPNPMPESIRDRPTKSHEHIWLLSKSERYYYDAEAIKEPASPDTHARYARGRSDAHKYADTTPVPGRKPQTITSTFAHMGAPKPAGWNEGEGGHGNFHPEGRRVGLPGQDRPRKGAPNGSGTKNNRSAAPNSAASTKAMLTVGSRKAGPREADQSSTAAMVSVATRLTAWLSCVRREK